MKLISTLVAALMTANIATANLTEPPAASRAFTSTDVVVVQARGLMNEGKFKEAEDLLKKSISGATAEERRDREETLDIIARTRWEYSMDEDTLLDKVREAVPDASPDEVTRWARDSRIRWRTIDGAKFYFRREPKNIFLFNNDAKKRRELAGNAPPEPKFDLVKHLKAVVDEAERSGQTEVLPVQHKFTETLTIPANSAGVKAGSIVKIWLPYPQEYRQQKNVKFISASPEPKSIAPTAVEGNPVTGAAQRTVYFEQRVEDPAKPIVIKLTYGYTSFAYYPKLEESKVQPLPKDWNGTDLNERLPHIAFTPEIRKEVAAVIGNETNALVKGRKLFRWVSANIPWNAEDEYCVIPSFAIKGFTARRGDCGVQNTIYITMCRIAGVPARWQSGYETKPGENWGMHDWAEIYIAPWGWLPADASYGVKKSDDPRVADFYCGHQDSYRMIVNLDWGREFLPPKLTVRSEPADCQRGEVEVDGKNFYYDQWEYKMEAERELLTQVQ